MHSKYEQKLFTNLMSNLMIVYVFWQIVFRVRVIYRERKFVTKGAQKGSSLITGAVKHTLHSLCKVLRHCTVV